MAYRIELAPSAFADIDAIVRYISVDSVHNGRRWRDRLLAKMDSLAIVPRGCSLAPENEYSEFEVRQFIFGRYRVLFTVLDDDSLVYVLSIRHGSRRFMSKEELDGIE